MKWQSGTAYFRRLLGVPVVLGLGRVAPAIGRADVIVLFGMLLDLAVSHACMGGGLSLRVSQTAGFLVAVAATQSWRLSTRDPAGPSPLTLIGSWLIVLLLAFSLRNGVLGLLLRTWSMPPNSAMVFAVIATGLVMHGGTRLAARSQWRELAMGFIGYAFLLRLLYSAQVELLPEETYYWNYSRHLDFGYLDHPPVVAWLIRAGTALFSDSEFGVRFGALCCGVVAAVFIFRLTRDLFGEASALVALVLAQLLPYFFFSGMLMTPDAPLFAAWAGSLYFLERAVLRGQSNAWFWFGLFLGIGLLSKYSIGLLALAAGIFILLDPSSRHWLRRREPYLAVVVAGLVFSPVVVWNAQHDWASFVFQTSRRLAELPRFSLHKLIGSALVLMTPTGVIAVWAAFARRATAAELPSKPDGRGREWRFIQVTLLVPLAVFFLFSLRHEVKLDWTGAPWVAALPLVAFYMTDSYRARPRTWAWLRMAWPPTLVGLALFYGAGLYYLAEGIPGVGYTTQTELIPVGWREFGRQVNELADQARARYGDNLLIVGMDRYAIASEVAFYSSDQIKSVAATSTAHLFDDMGLMYETWFPVARQTGRTLLLVGWSLDALAAPHLERHVDALEPIQEGNLYRDGSFIRHYYYRVAHGFHAVVTLGGTH